MNRLWLGLLLVYCGLIFYLSHQPLLSGVALFAHQDKVFHFVAYFIMGVLAYLAFACYASRGLAAFIFCVVYGATDEWHQSFVPGRMMDVYDWLADCAGAYVAVKCTQFFAENTRLGQRFL